MDKLEQLFLSYTGLGPESVTALSAAGSRRRYFRLQASGTTLIGVHGTDTDENRAFFSIASHLRSKGINVPEVKAVSEDGMFYLQEDLGDVLLYDRLGKSRMAGSYGPEESGLLCRVMSELPRIQFEGGEGMDFSVCYPAPSFNGRMVDFDLNYFKYCFLKPSSVEFHEERLQDDFERLKADLLGCSDGVFMYRDFQARNIMLKDDGLWFIDFQGGRRGPFFYDVASFVWQARASYPAALKKLLVDTYFEALQKYRRMDRAEFDSTLRKFVLFRTLQVLGAYGFRGRIEKRPHFIESIPYALANLRDILAEPFEEYPYLCDVLKKLASTAPAPSVQEPGKLEVHVLSFSYKKGIPEDWSGNGGGYVFDCRSVHNPGKYECYKHSTGLDEDVRKFLEEDGEITVFLSHVMPLVEAHVNRFVERGFSHLQIAFGCTGGQHRSAYCAQAVATRLAARNDVKVRLTHRELGIDKCL